jgi:glucose 1-dehydrogenase
VMECTGVDRLIFDALQVTARGGIVCLTGISTGGAALHVDVGALNRTMVLENDVVVGSVNANRRHYAAAAEALVHTDTGWLERLITRRGPFERWAEAVERRAEDVKTVIDLTL